MIPDALDAEVLAAVDGMRLTGERFDKERFRYFALAFEHQNPRMDAKSEKFIFRRQIQGLERSSTNTNQERTTTTTTINNKPQNLVPRHVTLLTRRELIDVFTFPCHAPC